MRYNTDFTPPIYIHSHIRTFEATIQKAVPIKETASLLENYYDSVVNRINDIIIRFKQETKELENLGVHLTADEDEQSLMFKKAKEIFIRGIETLPNKQDLVDQVAKNLQGSKEIEDIYNTRIDKIADVVLEAYSEDVAKNIQEEVVNKFYVNLGKIAGKNIGQKTVAVKSTDTLSDLGIQNFFKKGKTGNLNQMLNRTLKYGKERAAAVQAKYREDIAKFKEYLTMFQTVLNVLSSQTHNLNNVEKIKEPLKRLNDFRTTKKIKGGEVTLDFNLGYSQKTYPHLLSFINREMGYIYEVVSGIAFAEKLDKKRAELGETTVRLIPDDEQKTITSDLVARIKGINYGISVKSNLKQKFSHSIDFSTNPVLGDNAEKLAYFIANYRALSKWNVEQHGDASNSFSDVRVSRSMPFTDMYTNLIVVLDKVALLQSLLGTLFTDTTQDLESIVGKATSWPFVLQVYTKQYYMHEILETLKTYVGTREVQKATGGDTKEGFGVYLMGLRPKTDMKEIWSDKVNFIRRQMRRGNKQFGYGALKDVISSALPKGRLKARVNINLGEIFK